MKLAYIKRYKFSLICIILIWILCLMPVPEVKIAEDVPFIDKWTHIVMYLGTCMIMWLEYLNAHPEGICWKRLVIGAILSPILMSGLLELLQAYCTGGRRSGDWMDLAANTVGVALAAIFGYLFSGQYLKGKRKS